MEDKRRRTVRTETAEFDSQQRRKILLLLCTLGGDPDNTDRED